MLGRNSPTPAAPGPFNAEADAWTYDAIGNRLTNSVNGSSQAYVYFKNGSNPLNGQRLQTETRFAYSLQHGSRGWVINEVRESADRPADTRPPATRAPRRPDAVSR